MKFLTVLFIPLFMFMFNESSCKEKRAARKAKKELKAQQEEVAEEVPATPIQTKPLEELSAKDIVMANKGVSKERLQQIDALATDALRAKFKTFRAKNANKQTAQVFAFDAEDNNTYFMFDEGMALDLPAYVLNNKADTVCLTGGMRRIPNPEAKPCPTEKEGTRVVLWNN